MTPSNDPSLWSEPHLQGGGFRGDPSEARAAEALAAEHEADANNPDAFVDQSVWNEPGMEGAAGGAPVLDYGHWLDWRRATTTRAQSWGRVALVMLAAGPWAVLSALFGQGDSWPSILGVILAAPVLEEMLKVAVALYVVERRPYWFISPGQILLCGAASGLCFAALENVLYLYVYIQDASAWLWMWRWTVCTGLHVSCSLLASCGLVSTWKRVWLERRLGHLERTVPWLVGAMVLHGVYNALAVVLELGFGWH